MKQLFFLFVMLVVFSIQATAQTNDFGNQLSFDDVITNAESDNITFIVEHNKTADQSYKLLKSSMIELFPEGKNNLADDDSKKLVYLACVTYPTEQFTLCRSSNTLSFQLTIENKNNKSRVKIQNTSVLMVEMNSRSSQFSVSEYFCANPIAFGSGKTKIAKINPTMRKKAERIVSKRKELLFQTITDIQKFISDKLNEEGGDSDW